VNDHRVARFLRKDVDRLSHVPERRIAEAMVILTVRQQAAVEKLNKLLRDSKGAIQVVLDIDMLLGEF
jgi:hypothetical protein